MHIRRILVATIIGAFLSACLLSLIYALQYSALTVIFIFSTTPTASLLFWVLPDAFVYWLVPEGGGPAAMLLITFSAWLQYMLVFAVLTYIFLRQRFNSALKRDVPQALAP